MLAIFSRIDNWRRDWTENFAELDPKSDDPDLRPFVLPHGRDEVVSKIKDWAQQQSRWSVVSESLDEEAAKLHLTRTTPLFRFTDDIRVQLTTVPEGTQVTAESQSRVGKGDLGQNPRNLKELMRGLKGDWRG